MKITEVRIVLSQSNKTHTTKNTTHLEAFCSILFDSCFTVHDLRILSREGRYFLAMPSQKRQECCSDCSSKNNLDAKFCCECGSRLSLLTSAEDGKRIHRDVAHPINGEFRRYIEDTVIQEFKTMIKNKPAAA